MSAWRLFASRTMGEMPGMWTPNSSFVWRKLSKENTVNISVTSALSASSRAFKRSACVVGPRPTAVSLPSNFTPSPRNSGKSHQRTVLAPWARMSLSFAW